MEQPVGTVEDYIRARLIEAYEARLAECAWWCRFCGEQGEGETYGLPPFEWRWAPFEHVCTKPETPKIGLAC